MAGDLHLAPGDHGEAVRDLRGRLIAAGFANPSPEGDSYGELVEQAVRQFQEARCLPVTGICDQLTWSALVEAGHRLGDRLVYLRAPMLRGDDVSEIQLRLGALGFDAGRVDGIFGPQTERALKDFQRNCGLTVDGVAGPDAVGAMRRLSPRVEAPVPGAGVRERERLRRAPKALGDRRIVVGECGGLGVIATALAKVIQEAGAMVAVLEHPDPSVQASEANAFDADAYVGLEIDVAGPCRTAYYATAGFESAGGHRLADLVTDAIRSNLDISTADPRGVRLPVLRETRMTAVLCSLGPAEAIVESSAPLAQTLAYALSAWASSPVES